MVLLVHDTTDIDVSHRRKISGVGHIGNERGRGFFVQTVLAVRRERREVLGCLAQEPFVRIPAPDGEQRYQRRKREERETDVFIVNFANADMVGHTGKLDKTIEACQYVDTCLGWITKAMRAAKGTTLITADHGNAELMIDPKTGEPHTAHTTNPVPFHLIDEDSIGLKLRSEGALSDVAPTMLGLLGLEQPQEMTGRDLREG